MSIFSQIISGEIATAKIYEDEHCIVINDINPVAAIHFLVIPKQAVRNLSECHDKHQDLLGHLLLVAKKVAHDHGCEDNFKIVINNGSAAGQSVFHLHLHVLSGKINLNQLQ